MRLALGIEYDGTGYVGWQRQNNGTGVQKVVEDAIAGVANEVVEIVCAGRTDTGVHAAGQVVHFDTSADRSTRGWLLGINSNLPPDVNVTWASVVDDDFHARFSAESRTYTYLILNRLARSSLYRERAWWVHEPLDEQAMQAGGDMLLGKHDFSAFRAAGCQASSPLRSLSLLSVERRDCWIVITVTANAFLQHMVRNITGTLVAIGRGAKAPKWAGAVLESLDRKEGGMAAPAAGLTLQSVRYPERFDLPGGKPGQSPFLRL
jgi:tRNA pseudouridine38-40 synthase